MLKKLVTWDLGATKCAAAIVEYDPQTQAMQCQKVISVRLSETHSFLDLIQQLEARLGVSFTEVDAICIGAAGFYDGENLLLAGVYPYAMPFARVAQELKWSPYAVIHDYAPVVCATFTDYMNDTNNVKTIRAGKASPYGRRVAFGVGTGLGMKDGVLMPNGDFWLGQNEVGHIGVSLPPAANSIDQDRHLELMKFFLEACPEALTFEKMLSGQGTVRFYQFFHPNERDVTPEYVGQQMREGRAQETLDAFAWYLGLFVGTVQLTFMPEGGIWITGGVATQNLAAFDSSHFHAGIESSPSYLKQREDYPMGVLCNHEHALIGGGFYAAKRLLD